MKRISLSLLLCAGIASPGLAQDLTQAPPEGDYQKVSDLVALPEFVPGLGILYVQPDTPPPGPFLGYDRDGSRIVVGDAAVDKAAGSGSENDQLLPAAREAFPRGEEIIERGAVPLLNS